MNKRDAAALLYRLHGAQLMLTPDSAHQLMTSAMQALNSPNSEKANAEKFPHHRESRESENRRLDRMMKIETMGPTPQKHAEPTENQRVVSPLSQGVVSPAIQAKREQWAAIAQLCANSNYQYLAKEFIERDFSIEQARAELEKITATMEYKNTETFAVPGDPDFRI